MLRRIETKKAKVLTKKEQAKIFGSSCPIACNCGTWCGNNLAFRQSKTVSGLPD